MSMELSRRNLVRRRRWLWSSYGQGFSPDISWDEMMHVLHAGMYTMMVAMRWMETMMAQFMQLVAVGANL